MKYLIPALLLCGAFNYSCQKDGPEKDSPRLVLFKSATQFNSNISERSYEFQYDAQGRVTKVNDQVYYYGQNGKADYSRIEIRNQQMGFNPVDINQVISKNLEDTFFSTFVQGKTDQEMEPDWAKKTAVKITLDAGGKPTAMNYVVKADFGDAKDVILSEVLLNYVYE